MARFTAFSKRTKRDFDVESAKPLAELKEGQKFKMKDFEIYYAPTYSSEFAILKTDDDKLLSTWSKVIIEQLHTMLDDDDQREELQKNPYELQYVRKKSASGRDYENLETTEK